MAIVFGIVKPMLFVVLAFTTLRFFAGGTHMGTYLKCFLMTIFTFVPASLVAKYFSNILSVVFILGAFAISAIAIVFYAPKSSPLNQISDKKARTLKVLAIVTLALWFVISICLYLFWQAELVVSISICLGIILEVSSIVSVFETIYNKINTIKIGVKR